MTKRFLSLFLVIGLIVALAVPAYADEGVSSGWIDLLEVSSVREDGSNWFNIQGKTGTVSIPIPVEMRISKIDLLVTNLSSDPFTAASIVSGSNIQSLTIVQVNNVTTRIYGNVPTAYYKSIELKLTKSGSGTVTNQMLSCRVSSLGTIDSPAHGTLKRAYNDPNPLSLPNNFSVEGTYSSGYEYVLVPVSITDWRKYDKVTLFGSITRMALNSFRASVGSKGLPYEISYMESIPTGTESDGWLGYEYVSGTETNYYVVEGTPDEWSVEEGTGSGEFGSYATVTYGGAVLFTITIDLSGVDRTVSGDLDCFFTCIADSSLGYAFNVQNATGSVLVADTTDVSWWTRFTTFMTDLFGGDTSEADQFADEMEQTNQELEDANQQLDSVTKPAVEDVPIDPSQYIDPGGMFYTGQIFQRLLGNELVLPMVSITLVCGLAAFIIF